MPEATIDKDRNLGRNKNNVGGPTQLTQRSPLNSKSKAASMKLRPKRFLGRSAALLHSGKPS